jgi:hypothetical protein
MALETIDNAKLFTLSFEQLEDLFRNSEAGPIPNGIADGMAIVAPGTPMTPELAQMINVFVWKGKEFDAEHGTLTNRILPFGLNAVVAQVYRAPSWLDEKECIVLDYSKTSLIAHWVRDEIRLIGPGFYLGRVYWDKTAILHFSLDFRQT